MGPQGIFSLKWYCFLTGCIVAEPSQTHTQTGINYFLFTWVCNIGVHVQLDPRDWETRVKSKSTCIAFAILILFFGAQCQKEFTVPEELIGVWVTDDPIDAYHLFEIKEDTLIFEQDLGYFDFDVFPIVGLDKSGENGDTLYIIYYLIASGRKFEFSFYYTPTEGGVIRFKNQPEMKWTKKKP